MAPSIRVECPECRRAMRFDAGTIAGSFARWCACGAWYRVTIQPTGTVHFTPLVSGQVFPGVAS